MKYYVVLGIVTIDFKILSVQSDFIQPFLMPSIENIAICSDTFEDMFYDALIPKIGQGILVGEWDCEIIPKVYNSLIILDEVQPDKVINMLNQEGIQKNLLNNIWIIHFKNQYRQIKDFFVGNNLKIGSNANIFAIESSKSYHEVTQILGTGTINVEYKVSMKKL